MAIIGIDLGTTNSLAAVWRNGRSELIPNALGEYLTPSVVSVDEDGSILTGRAARERLITHPERTAATFKRDMGTRKTYVLGGQSFYPEELSSFLLRSLRQDAEMYLGEAVTEAVISVPAYFAEAQRAATKRAGALAGLRVERLVNEPTAAAVTGRITQGGEDKICLVFDLGGGTLDVSLVERFGDVISVTAASGDNHLGGRDFDLAIAEGFCQDCGLPFQKLSVRQREMIVRQAEVCKKALSTQEPVLMAVQDGEISASLLLSSDWLIRKCGALFRRMTEPVRKVFLDSGIPAQELEDLVMVGGSSHMPSVRRYISRFLQMEPLADSRPDTAVALGAGLCAGLKAKAPELRELILTDVCPYTLGVDVINRGDPSRMLMAPVIERNSVLPASKVAVFSTAVDGQKRVTFHIYQGENRYCADNLLLGEVTLDVPPGPKGKQAVRVRFTYDINGLLEVEAVNTMGNGVRRIIRSGDMSPEEAARRLRELSELKMHPRELEGNRALAARGERLYAMTVGSVREQVAEALDWFQEQLNSQEPLRIARARRYAEQIFDQVEAWMGAVEDWPEEEEFSDEDDDSPEDDLSEEGEEDGFPGSGNWPGNGFPHGGNVLDFPDGGEDDGEAGP